MYANNSTCGCDSFQDIKNKVSPLRELKKLREAAKKYFTNGRAIKRGGGVKAGPLRKKDIF